MENIYFDEKQSQQLNTQFDLLFIYVEIKFGSKNKKNMIKYTENLLQIAKRNK